MYTAKVQAAKTPKVRIIKATKSLYGNDRDFRKLRVCAYGRVSTEKEEQESSIVAQKNHFIELIHNTNEWEFVKYFEDHGISGKSVKNRLGFLEMLDYAKKGKIDLILTKSVSRFSRNVVDAISFARLFKSFGVEIHFEQDGIKTFEPDAELRLTIMSMMAQDEILRQSESVKFGQIERVKQGKATYQFKKWYGYEKGIDGKPVIIPEQALVIEYIYSSYLSGQSLNKIKISLSEKGLKTKLQSEFSIEAIKRILTDPRYCGNYVYGKKTKVDPFSTKMVLNTGQSAKIELHQAHDGIVTEETWNLVQSELYRRNDIKTEVVGDIEPSRYSSLYALKEKLYCSKCKSSMIRKTWKNRDGSNRYVWKCKGREKGEGCDAEVIDEHRIHEAIIESLNKYLSNKSDLIDIVNKNIEIALTSNAHGENPRTLINEITALEKNFSELISLSIKSNQPEMFEERFKEISDMISYKKQKYDEIESSDKLKKEVAEKLKLVNTYIEMSPKNITEYDDSLVRQTITKIGVLDYDHIKIHFIDGREVTQLMPKRK